MTNLTSLSRRLYGDGLDPCSATTVWANAWLKMLLTQDGSATLLCEAVAGGPVDLTILHQVVTDEVPDEVRSHLPGNTFIERQVCVSFRNEVMMDNLSYIALDAIDLEMRDFLETRQSPIGHIFERKWTRKKQVLGPLSIQARLWDRSGMPDPLAVRNYLLEMPDATAMLITETFRAGMRFGMPVADNDLRLTSGPS